MISIKGIPKARVLMQLYNASKQQGMGFLHVRGANEMTEVDAEIAITENPRMYFDYLYGRVMKVDLSKDTFDPFLYDRDNGQGAAARAIK